LAQLLHQHGTMRFPEQRILSVALVCGVFACLPHAVDAQPGRVDLPDRIRGAQRVVVGVVADVAPEFRENEFGDQLIVSRTTVVVEEVLKGPANTPTIEVDVEGGTIGDLTLSVSDLEPIGLGERGVFLLSQSPSGAFVPHLRGQGLLQLDTQDQVRGEPWSLADIRAAAQAANGRQ